MKLMNNAILGLGLAGLILLSGCESDKKTTAAKSGETVSMGMVNHKCPISGEPVNASAKAATYEGHSVGFCCDGCAGKWAKASDADKAKMYAKCIAK